MMDKNSVFKIELLYLMNIYFLNTVLSTTDWESHTPSTRDDHLHQMRSGLRSFKHNRRNESSRNPVHDVRTVLPAYLPLLHDGEYFAFFVNLNNRSHYWKKSNHHTQKNISNKYFLFMSNSNSPSKTFNTNWEKETRWFRAEEVSNICFF